MDAVHPHFYVLSFLVLVLASAATQTNALARASIGSTLIDTLEAGNHANVFVTMRAQLDSSSLSSISFASRGARIATLRESLIKFAEQSQSSVLGQIQSSGETRSKPVQFETHSFWISNQIYVKGADSELVELLSLREDVGRIDEEEIHYLDDPQNAHEAMTINDNDGAAMAMAKANQWGVVKVAAPTVWDMVGGTDGTGITVGVIDTGARHTHNILRGSYANDGYGWFDPINRRTLPYDDNGHGSHVTGTITGDAGFGVAPGAIWRSCKSFKADGSGAQSDTLACFQFMLCPTTPSGVSPDCSKAPRVVNNSWSRLGGSTIYNTAIERWHDAGIVPVFANGNEGERGCGTVGSPADQNTIGVGASMDNDGLAVFSSRGPTSRGGVKPDVSAPGFSIRSASNMSDTGEAIKHGTSMASPHVTGVIALLLSYKPTLPYIGVKELLEKGAATGLTFSSETCGDILDSEFPNNHFGHGRIDAYATIRLSEGYVPPTTTSTTTTTTTTTTERSSGAMTAPQLPCGKHSLIFSVFVFIATVTKIVI